MFKYWGKDASCSSSNKAHSDWLPREADSCISWETENVRSLCRNSGLANVDYPAGFV